MRAQAVQRQYTERNVNPEVLDWLGESAVFKGLGPKSLEAFANACVLRGFEPLEEVINEGEAFTTMNIVVSGRFVILLPSERLTRFADNALVSLDCYVAGDSFGEASLLEDMPVAVSASIVATESSQVLTFTRQNFETAIAAANKIGQVVYRNLFSLQTRRLGVLAG